MKCYYSRIDEDVTQQVSLGEALMLVCEYWEELPDVKCADMLQLSSQAHPVTVSDGCVWVEDNVPVLDFDRVVSDWWHLNCKDLPKTWVHLLISCSNDPWVLGDPKVQYVGKDHAFYPTSEEALATFKEPTNVSPDPEPQGVEQHEPGGENWSGWKDYP